MLEIIIVLTSVINSITKVNGNPQFFLRQPGESLPWNYDNRYGGASDIESSFSFRPQNERFYPMVMTPARYPPQQPIFPLQPQPPPQQPQPQSPNSWPQYQPTPAPPPHSPSSPLVPVNTDLMNTLFLQPLLAIDSQVFALYQLIKCFEKQGDLKRCVKLIEKADKLFEKKMKKKKNSKKRKNRKNENRKRKQNNRQNDDEDDEEDQDIDDGQDEDDEGDDEDEEDDDQ